jgi:hypothetical protein
VLVELVLAVEAPVPPVARPPVPEQEAAAARTTIDPSKRDVVIGSMTRSG